MHAPLQHPVPWIAVLLFCSTSCKELYDWTVSLAVSAASKLTAFPNNPQHDVKQATLLPDTA